MKWDIPDEWIAAGLIVGGLFLISAGFIAGTILGWIKNWK